MVTEYEIHEFRRTRRSTLIEREYSNSRADELCRLLDQEERRTGR